MMKKNRVPAISRAGLLGAAVLTQAATAQTANWTNYTPGVSPVPTYYWGDTATWDTGVVPDGVGASANIAIDLSGTNSPSFRLSSSAVPNTPVVRTLGSLMVGDTGATTATNGTPTAFTFGSFNFDNGGLGASLITASSPAVFVSGTPSRSVVAMGGINLNDNLTITNNLGPAPGSFDSATMPLSALSVTSIAETGGPRKLTVTSADGRGTTSLGASSYSGGTDVLSGRLAGGDSTSFGTGAVKVSSGAQVLINAPSGTIANDFVLNGNGFTEVSGQNGALYIGANNSTTAREHVFTGSIAIQSATRIGTWSNVTANLNGALTGSSDLQLVGGTVRLNGNGFGYTGTITATQGRVDVNGTLGGNLAVTNFAGSLGGNGYIAGNLDLAAAGGGPPLGTTFVVNPAAPGNLRVGGNVTINGPTTVQLTSAPLASQTILNYGGSLTGVANLDLEGGLANYRAGTGFSTSTPGAVILNFVTGTVTWNGGVSGSWSNFGAGWAGGDTFRSFDNVVFNDTATGVVNISGNLNAGTITVNNSAGQTHTLQALGGSSIAAGSLVKNGDGVLVMGNTTGTNDNRNTYAGGTVINAGTVRLSRSGDSTLTYGALGVGAIELKGGTLSSDGTGARSIYNATRFNGNFALGAAATYTGQLTFNNGVTVTGNSVVNIAGSQQVLIGTGSTSGGLSGSASLTKTGTGNLRVNGNSTYSGAISVQGGSLTVGTSATLTIAKGGSLKTEGGSLVAGTAASSRIVIKDGATFGGVGSVGVNTTIEGTHSVGNSPGLQSFSNGLAYAATAVFAMEMTDPTGGRGVAFDAVDVSAGAFSIADGALMTLALDGSVNFSDVFWDSNQQWLVVDLASTVTGDGGTGTFAGPHFTGGQNYNYSEGYFTTTRVTDGNGKNDVYLNWTAVPEPSSSLLLILGASLAGCRRRRD